MTNVAFRPAVRENVGLLIIISGGTGSGKTYSAMELASGIATAKDPEGRFAVIDTENRRASHYADFFAFDVFDMEPPFRPGAYAEAIKAADKAGYPVIVIDSLSHEWIGEGGVLEWHEEELKGKGGGANQNMAAWIKPKMAHQRMINDMLRAKAHIIVCLRAAEKVDIIREGNETKIVAKQSLTGLDGWMPLTSKDLPFEATCSFLLKAEHPGYPLPIKLQRQHLDLFPTDQPINAEAGRRIVEWATGGKKRPEDLTLEQKIANVIEFFTRREVTPDTIFTYLEVEGQADITEEQFNHLRLLAEDVRSGALLIADAFKK